MTPKALTKQILNIMSNPKEKAKQLIDIFKPNAYRGACEENDELMELYHAKQCALIAVYEILKAYKYSNELTNEICSILLFYNEVKQEIEKL